MGIVGWWWLDRRDFETTDNAYVEADIVLLSPQVSGFVTRILVTQNDMVKPGHVVGLVEPADSELQLQAALAKRNEAKAALHQLGRRRAERDALLREKAATLTGSEAEREAAVKEQERLEPLAAEGWVSKKLLQSAIADAAKSRAMVQQTRASLAAEAARGSALSSEGEELAARVAATEAEVERHRLDLKRTSLRSPVGGTVGPVLVRVGEFVKPGDVIMHIVPARERYVIANFKETQLRRLRLGQRVRITLDAFPDRPFEGRIESFSPATGSKFSALPIENANGNFVKIVQRLPVRIAITSPDAAQLLRPGLSAEVRVDVSGAR